MSLLSTLRDLFILRALFPKKSHPSHNSNCANLPDDPNLPDFLIDDALLDTLDDDF